jgi:hypothetical protein
MPLPEPAPLNEQTMKTISPSSLLTLEAYARQRTEFRARVLTHKKTRTLHIGDHVTLLFEDELTVRYQVQEMLRIEKTFEEAGIRDELDAYNPLIPDGANLKATMLIEYEDEQERARALARLIGIEGRVYVQVDGSAPAYAIADEDLARDNGQKTSAVHFLRFEFPPAAIAAFRGGASVAVGIDHDHYRARVDEIAPQMQGALARDFG